MIESILFALIAKHGFGAAFCATAVAPWPPPVSEDEAQLELGGETVAAWGLHGALHFRRAKNGPPGTKGSPDVKVSSLAVMVAARPVGSLIVTDLIDLVGSGSRLIVIAGGDCALTLARNDCLGSTPIATSL